MNILKYKTLATQSPQAAELQKAIETNWAEWVQIVKGTNMIFRYRTKHPQESWDSCAAMIFLDALWGYGISGWQENSAAAANFTRKHYGTGHVCENIPWEYYFLDRWLEKIMP